MLPHLHCHHHLPPDLWNSLLTGLPASTFIPLQSILPTVAGSLLSLIAVKETSHDISARTQVPSQDLQGPAFLIPLPSAS